MQKYYFLQPDSGEKGKNRKLKKQKFDFEIIDITVSSNIYN